jgi:predicted ATP-grasp superfamily ATP-dependent carboligase
MTDPDLLIFGASARAAAFSALRAGLHPWCADLFADTDLAVRCPVVRIPPERYPHAFLDLLDTAPHAPWLYTGGLENRPALIAKMARRAPLWGNDRRVLQRVRDPFFIADLLARQDLPVPEVRRVENGAPAKADWLVKPRAGAGGVGIQRWHSEIALSQAPGRLYLQEFIEGEPCAAVFVAFPQETRLVGITQQLVGTSWLHAPAFSYCGSISFTPSAELTQRMQQMGDVLARGCDLMGIFGVDFILRDGVPYLIEVNPRYTASVEVIEHATGVAALALHRAVFDAAIKDSPWRTADRGCVGKAILFAPETVVFPHEGAWRSSPISLPAFADVPAAGEVIPAGRPIFTLLVRDVDPVKCVENLQRRATQTLTLLKSP